MTVLEEMIDAILKGDGFGRPLTFPERQTVEHFKRLMGEYTSRRIVELEFEVDQCGRKAKSMRDRMDMDRLAFNYQEAMYDVDDALPRL